MDIGKKNKAVVCWSGGRDSTLILANLLEMKTIKVRTLTIIHDQVGAEKTQRLARENIKKKLVKKYGDFESGEITIKGENCEGISSGCVQPLLWIPAASVYIQNSEDLYMGYVKGDDVWHNKSELYSLFSTSMKLLDKDSELICPLEWYDKRYVIEVLSSNSLDIFKDTWYCQTNDKIPCGHCASCQSNDMVMYYIDVMNKKAPIKLKKQKN